MSARALAVCVVALAATLGGAASRANGSRSTANGLIVFEVTVHGVSQLDTIKPDGTGLRRVTNLVVPKNQSGPEQANWSPDGSKIIFDAGYEQTATGTINVFTIAPDGNGLTKLPIPVGRFDGAPAYSHDGTKISFDWGASATPTSPNGIDVANSDGSNPRRLTKLANSKTYDTRSNWSPDGKWLAFTRVLPSGENADFKVRADGTGMKRLTSWAMDANNAKWSPDGSKILFNSYADPKPGKDANIYTMRPDGSGIVQLTHYTGGKLQAYVGGWSPDGTHVVFHLRGPSETALGLNQLFVMNADGTGVRQLTHLPQGMNPSHPAWGTTTP
jgi:TolB protein